MQGKVKVVSFRPQTALSRGSAGSASTQNLSLNHKSAERVSKNPRIQSSHFQLKKSLINNPDSQDQDELMIPVPQKQDRQMHNLKSVHVESQPDLTQVTTLKPENEFTLSLEADLPKFKMFMPIPERSQYQAKYIRHAPSHQLNSVNNLLFDTYKDELKMLMTTTNMDAFKKMKSYPIPLSTKPRPQTSIAPFSSGTSYQTTFFKKDGIKLDIISQNHPTVMKDLEFLGDTVYKSTFKGQALTNEPFYNFGARSSFKNPMTIDLPFFSKSSSSFTFRPHKIKHLNPQKNQDDIVKVPSFFGQYDTQYKQHYSSHGIVENGLSVQSTKKLINDRKECQNASKRILPIF